MKITLSGMPKTGFLASQPILRTWCIVLLDMIDKNYFESGPVGEGLMRNICVKVFFNQEPAVREGFSFLFICSGSCFVWLSGTF